MIDQENDDAVMSVVSTAFDGVGLDRDVQDVVTRGRALRRRKRAMPAFAAVGVLAVSLGLAVAAQPGDGHSLAYNGAVVNVDNAGFSVHTDAKTGEVTVTIKQYFDPDQLRIILTEAGIRSDVRMAEDIDTTVGKNTTEVTGCADTPGVTRLPQIAQVVPVNKAGSPDVVVIDPAAMPAGSVLVITYFERAHQVGFAPAGTAGVGAELDSKDPGKCIVPPAPIVPASQPASTSPSLPASPSASVG